MKMIREEFEGNILVTISENEVRLWVCDQERQNIFRFKAIGNVYKSGNDITVMADCFNRQNKSKPFDKIRLLKIAPRVFRECLFGRRNRFK